MKNHSIIITLILFLFASTHALAQQSDSTISIDQLQTPSSPALNLLGVNSDNIERPKNLTDISVSLANATQNFSVIPKSYALDFAPYWIFAGRNTSFKDFISNKVGKNILQTADISVGTSMSISNIDSSQFNQIAIGLKFSILRGNVDKNFKKWNDSAGYYLDKHAKMKAHLIDSLNSSSSNEKKNQILKALRDNNTTQAAKDSLKNEYELTGSQFDALVKTINDLKLKNDSDLKNNLNILNGLASRTDFKREGWKLDAAFGTVLDYPNNNFENCYVSKIAGWFTGGYESSNNASILGVLRITEDLYRQIFNDTFGIVNDINIGSLDWGVRVFRDFTPKLTLSFEYIGRNPVFYDSKKLAANNISAPKVTNRYVASANYKVGKNQNISFSFGKNFDNSVIKTSKSDLIAALSLGLGFGSNRTTVSGISK